MRTNTGLTLNSVEPVPKRGGGRLKLEGLRFGRLEVLSYAGWRPRGRRRSIFYTCRCDWGSETVVEACNLREGNVKNCSACGWGRK